jgi:hypothetical protein
MRGVRTRGDSLITQQLLKNLRPKGAEFTLVPVAELVLGTRLMLEIYLNVVE